MPMTFSINTIRGLAYQDNLEKVLDQFKEFVIHDDVFTSDTVVYCYKEQRPYVSPNDDSYNDRWEIEPRDLRLIVMGFKAGIHFLEKSIQESKEIK